MIRFLRCAVVFCVAGVGASANAQHQPLGFYQQHNLVSDGFIPADHTDANLVNAWGLQFNPTGPWWVNDADSGVSTLYDQPGTPQPLVVSIPAGPANPGALGHPTGIVFNGGSGFVVSDGNHSAPARFIFSTEDGSIAAWAPSVPPPAPSMQAFTVVPAPGAPPSGAIYKGLAIGNNGAGDFIYATDFHNARIDVFDSAFQAAAMPGRFSDPNLPDRFAPFGIRNIGGELFVTFAMQDDDAEDDVAGNGLGVVDVFDLNGNLLRRLVTGDKLNAPWGLALAPDNFGRLSGSLLVGNFGNGRINAYDPMTGEPRGTMLAPRGGPVEIDGLWALSFGNDAAAGPSNVLFFTAGPGDEEHGLFGSLTAVAAGEVNGHHGGHGS